MAHFARVNKAGIVEKVFVISNDVLLDDSNNEQEALGAAFCQTLYGDEHRYIQTSYNSTFRKNYASVGYTYDSDRDAFIPPSNPRYPSWVLDSDTCQWVAPIDIPTGEPYEWMWIEETQSWDSA